MAQIDYETNLHRYWMNVVREERNGSSAQVIDCIKQRFNRGIISESQLICWGREFELCPHALVETLLYYGSDV